MSKYEIIVIGNHEKIKEDYNKIYEFVSEFAKNTNDNILFVLKDFVVELFVDLSSDNLLKVMDEEIFNYCNHINNYYKKFTDFYFENEFKILKKSNREILEGINLVLNSQINQYFEIYNETGINPILEEKMLIIKNHIDNFLNYYNFNLEKYKNILDGNTTNIILPKIFYSNNKEEFFINSITEQIEEKIISEVFEKYKEIKIKCQMSINDLENRKITSKYLEILKLEYEILNNLSKNHINLLDENIKEDITNEEKESVITLIEIIKNANEYINDKFIGLTDFLDNAESNTDMHQYDLNRFYKEFNLYLNSNFSNYEKEINFFVNILVEKYFNLENKIFNVASELIKIELDQRCLKIIDYFKSLYKKTDRMTHELLRIIKLLISYYETNKDNYRLIKEKDVLKGINETMEIKVETISEALLELKIEKNEILKSFFVGQVEISENESEKIIKEINNNLNEESLAYVDVIFDVLLKGEVLKNIIDQKYRTIEERKEKVLKKLLDYKQQIILNEIITFEEISLYSIERLKQSEETIVLDYVDTFLRSINSIDNFLEKHSIKKIIPNPHDVFDAKEHEILLAETKEGFSKGEIIKTVNNGFKEYDEVLIRANVIAAR